MTNRVTLGGDVRLTRAGDIRVTLGGADEGGGGGTINSGVGRDAPTYTIDLCVNWTKIGEGTTCTLDAVIRHLTPGEWSLAGHVHTVDLEAGFALADVDTIRLVDNNGGTIVFGGYVAPAASGVGGLEVVEDGRGAAFTMRGVDMWLPLVNRVAYPTPSTDPPWAAGHDERTGVASTVAAGYINANLGPAALVNRRIPIAVIDGATGSTGSWSARLQPLSELVARVCADGGITCRATVGFDGTVTFFLGDVRDRSSTGVLSDQGDLTNIHKATIPANATYVIAGGQGQLEARAFTTAGNVAGIARREMFSDQSSLTTVAELSQAAATTLATNSGTVSVLADVATFAAEHLVFGDDYDIGDILAVEIDGIRYAVPITAVTFHVGADRSVVKPTFAASSANPLSGLIRDVANLQSRFQTQIA